MRHSQDEINEIWEFTKKGRYAGSSFHHIPAIISDDKSEQCISIPNEDGSHRELYSRKNESDKWCIVPYTGEPNRIFLY